MKANSLLFGFVASAIVGCAVAPQQPASPPIAQALPPAAGEAPPLVKFHAALPLAPEAAPLHAPKIYRPGNVLKGCPPEGDAKPDGVKAVNILKNRIEPPKSDDFDPNATIASMLHSGEDDSRWDDKQAATIVGYVRDVKPGGIETCNCHAKSLDDRDTHIELVLDPSHAADTDVLIVEVTPRWRDFAKANGVDWSTPTLKASIANKWVRVTGWMMYDYEHENASENTAPGKSGNWRRTAWEIHPITQLEIMNRPQ